MSEVSEDTVPITFTPPLWEQRISKVKYLLTQTKLKELCDLGCGSGKLLQEFIYFKGLNKLFGVDIDSDSLNQASLNCAPGASAYIIKRKTELDITLIQGSILDLCPLIPFQVQSVSLCEVIEHIYLHEVPQLTSHIFSYINPETVVVTTPNRDFNFYFPDPNRFRHFDHKFEWTREEFRNWANQVCSDFKYSVEFTGVGTAAGKTDKGFCTQIAVFKREKRKKTRKEPAGEFRVVKKVIVQKNFPADFEERFYFDFLYSFNVVRGWEEEDYSAGLLLERIFRVPCVNMLCDGSVNRFRGLVERVLKKYGRGYKIEEEKIYIENDRSEESEEFDYNMDIGEV